MFRMLMPSQRPLRPARLPHQTVGLSLATPGICGRPTGQRARLVLPESMLRWARQSLHARRVQQQMSRILTPSRHPSVSPSPSPQPQRPSPHSVQLEPPLWLAGHVHAVQFLYCLIVVCLPFCRGRYTDSHRHTHIVSWAIDNRARVAQKTNRQRLTDIDA